MKNGKIKETLQSRKFWLTIGTMALGLALFLSGQIDIDKMTEIFRWAAGLYMGTLGFEDGLKKMVPIVMEVFKAK